MSFVFSFVNYLHLLMFLLFVDDSKNDHLREMKEQRADWSSIWGIDVIWYLRIWKGLFCFLVIFLLINCGFSLRLLYLYNAWTTICFFLDYSKP